MSMQRWDPFSDMLSLRDAMGQLFDQSMVRPREGMSGGSGGLAMDLYAEDDHYVLEIALAGVNRDSLEITAHGNQLMLQGEFAAPAEQQGRHYLYRQLPRGRFEQTVTIPTEVDANKIQAHYENGLLRLTLPKAASARRQRIAIQSGQAQQGKGAQSQRS
jgi:HSP20 family protein